IGNQPPAVNAGPDWVISTGGSVNLSATFTDTPSDTPWSYTITWGDGSVQSSTATASPIISSHAYATSGQYTLLVSVTDRRGLTGSDNAIVNVSDATPSQVLVGAGDIARCDRTDDEATDISGTVFTIGDNVLGSSSVVPDFTNCYAPSTTWGRFKARTRPAPGHMESWSPGSATYYDYWGTAAGTRGSGYYSYDLGAWHIVVLNSGGDISTAAGSAQELWLKADLAASTKQCTIAIWHHPRFSSTGTALRAEVKPFWDDLYAAGAELVLNAHYEVYERFAPQTPDGVSDPLRGIRQFTVGTGGIGTGAVTAVQPNSEVRNPVVYGVLKLTLSTTGYTWQFISVGGTFTDTGSGSCH
ncbi:MAG: alkaline phosphatase, partial [Gemmatimonadetes bacterium]